VSAELAFQEELEKLDELRGKLLKAAENLLNYTSSGKALDSRVKFFKLFGKFQGNITLATGIAETYLQQIQSSLTPSPPSAAPAPVHVETSPQQQTPSGSSWTGLGRIVVAVATLIMCYAAVHQGWLPQELFFWLLAASITLISLPPIIETAYRIATSRKKEPMEEQQPLAARLKKINDALDEMGDVYEYYYLKVLDQGYIGKVSRYGAVGKREEMYVPKKQAEMRIHFYFAKKVNWIIRECEETIWSRKTSIASAMVEVGKAAPTYPMRSGIG